MLNLLGVNKNSLTAGPGGERFEIFLKGCIRGLINPCPGCFNESSWTFAGESREISAEELHSILLNEAHHRRFTVCGGEPMLQVKALLPLLRKLSKDGFHTTMYTAYDAEKLLKGGLAFTWREGMEEAMRERLMQYAVSYQVKADGSVVFRIATPEMIEELFSLIDLLVDGDYQPTKRLTRSYTMEEGWFVGSSNQRLIDTKTTVMLGRFIYDEPERIKEAMLK